MTLGNDVSPERREILDLRSRIVVLERLAWIGIRAAAEANPDELARQLDDGRQAIAKGYGNGTLAPEIVDPAERRYLTDLVDDMLRSVSEDHLESILTP